MSKPPRIADVQCSRFQFQSGDRILVKTYHSLDRDEQKKLRRSIQRWAGPDVEILIVDQTRMDVIIEKR